MRASPDAVLDAVGRRRGDESLMKAGLDAMLAHEAGQLARSAAG